MLSIQNLSYFIGGRALYENASVHIKPKDKVGLIGLNGKGKSTLLRIIDGEYQYDEGSISMSKGCTVGFLNQDLLSYQTEDSILSVAMEAFTEAVEAQKRIESILRQMETNYTDDLVEKLTKAQERFEAMDGYTMQAKAEEILEGIGFKTSDLHRPLKEFSGGWRMRVMLAKLLLEKPSLLMLDEPTNHLDLPSIEWIENYLKTYEGAVIVVSHDRQFINNCVTKIVEVTQRQLVSYEGNYDFYLEEKALRSEIQKSAFENQQQQIKQTEKFIERFRAKASKARQVQSRVKNLERLDIIEDVVEDTSAINFKFRFKQKSGRFVVNLDNISKSYGDLQLLKNTTAAIERGDKIALIGANGKGKSTLLRIIAGSEKIEGTRTPGFNVNTGFYAQHQLESLHVNNEILEELKQAGSDKTDLELRQLLGCFLFSNDDVFKKIKVLSGGEKSRVALAKTLISEANFLMLDEPTNHLDFISENILIQALQQYEGSFVVVSHNRHFVSQVANKIWYIEDREIKEYPGTYEEYEYWRSQQTDKPTSSPSPEKKEKKQIEKPHHINEDEKLIKKLKQQIGEIEKEIDHLEREKKRIEEEMTKPKVYNNPRTMKDMNEEFNLVKSQLDKANNDWEKKVMELEGLGAN